MGASEFLGGNSMLSNTKDYERYLKEEYQPALDWYKKSESREWIMRNIPTLNELLEQNFSKIQPGVYCIHFNDIPVYVGQAKKASNRLLVHAHNLYRKPLDYFGVEDEEITSGKVSIQVTILKENISQESLRKVNELSYINKLKPVLQTSGGTDKCIPRIDRRRVIMKEIFN